MKRLVYNPRVDVYVKADTGIYDLSPYVVSCTVDRKVGQVSSAQVVFRNPDFMFTEAKSKDPTSDHVSIGPVFHPMDPIVITMTRLVDRPIQVFTGYCDSTPYFQLFPGVATITASCTLKRLMYTYWDPGLPFVWEYLIQHNWQPNSQMGGISSITREDKDFLDGKLKKDAKLKDPGLGQLLFDVLHDIGGWNPDSIFIEKIPPKLIDLISNLFDQFKGDSQQSAAEFQELMHDLLGGNTIGGSIGGGTTGGHSSSGTDGTLSGSIISKEEAEFSVKLSVKTGLLATVIGGWVVMESGANAHHNPDGNFNFLNIGPHSSDSAFNQMDSAVAATKAVIDQSNMSAITKSVGKGEAAQCNAIISSPWGTVGNILALAKQLKFTPNKTSSGSHPQPHHNNSSNRHPGANA